MNFLRVVALGGRPGFMHSAVKPSKTLFARFFASLVVKVPPMADSITEGVLGTWEKKTGEHIKRDELVASIETDKITLPVNSPEEGVLVEMFAQPGDTVTVGADLYKLELGGPVADSTATPKKKEKAVSDEPAQKTPEPVTKEQETPPSRKLKSSSVSGGVTAAPAAPIAATKAETANSVPSSRSSTSSQPAQGATSATATVPSTTRTEKVTRMTPMRTRIAQRLKESQESAAALTTFNEVDMSALMEMRGLYKDDIMKKHGVKFGFMSPFIKAAAIALRDVPMVNARIEGSDVIQPSFVDISVAVATPKGLVTPVLRNCERLSIIEIEKEMALLGEKARTNQLTMAELSGGTFTISNGGVFGSLMGTPIINVPQSAILGMHAIKERPVALNGQVVIRPIMNLALTYDHRIIDGREAVTFLVKLKNLLEDPRRFLLDL